MAKTFESLDIRSVHIRNRIVVSPMCQYSSLNGFANDWHLVHLGSRATGGAGLVFTEATAVSPEGRITDHDLGIYVDAHIEQLQRITRFIHEQGAIAGIQLAHAGRKASHHRPWEGNAALTLDEGAWPTLAPSAIAYKAGEPQPEELTAEGIADVISGFQKAAIRSREAGFDIIELHAAHGYLLHQFLSPLSNQRTDAYGGSFENRIRIIIETVQAVRAVWPDTLPLFVRISATDWAPGGWTDDESVELARILAGAGVDLIDVSSGGNVPQQKIPVGPLYQVPFCARIRREAGVKTGAVGLITTASEVEHILESGQADLVFMARELLRNPTFPLQAATESGVDIAWPVQYERARPGKK